MWCVGLFIGKFFLSLRDLSRVREDCIQVNRKTKLNYNYINLLIF